jgi:hypothetical protein
MRLGRTRRLTTEGCLKFDASALRRDGVFVAKPGTLFASTWTDPSGQEILRATLWLELETSGRLALRIVHGDFKALPAPANLSRLTIELVTTPCRFGGQRFWFLCPLTRDGIPCKRRVRVLHLPAGAQFFGCRACHDLTYRSCQEHNKRIDSLLRAPDELMRLPAAAKESV